jgi:hypothetical protein
MAIGVAATKDEPFKSRPEAVRSLAHPDEFGALHGLPAGATASSYGDTG